MQIKFLGATGTVTGSKYLLKVGGKRFLVDCGLFQGYKELRLRNWKPLPVEPAAIDAVIITHAHIDHTGYLPLLVKQGFRGPIYATSATCDLCEILLPDSGYLQEEDAKRANRYGYSKHHPAEPLYTQADAERALQQFKPVEFGQPYAILPDEGTVTWHRAGHILGAALVQVQAEGTRLLFTGDLGRPDDPFMHSPAIIQDTDYLVTESTYGNRLHEDSDPIQELGEVINETAQRGGTVLIPSFAVGRAQNLLYYLYQLKEEKAIPDLPVYLDSPMAIDATKLLCQHTNDHRLSQALCSQICHVATYTNTPEASKAIDNNYEPKIVISASGMATGGRVLHHLKVFAPHARNTILFTGYQAGGTRGAKLLDGASEVKIHGQLFPVSAQVKSLTNTSAHADYAEMLAWLQHFKRPPRKVFITHGEPEAAQSLKQRIESQLGWNCQIPDYLDEETL